ncbi:hypothetical protein B0H16DRAFT_1857876 [Mycena metata]|uniref:Uncharacterized protein n=1 Tax=Mycena metata TaxID=1033252 RepID=A0AAD7N4S2_9AGAR|nr:hypothetical protein B0H16DRAFT_1857876 [Mycena metata]
MDTVRTYIHRMCGIHGKPNPAPVIGNRYRGKASGFHSTLLLCVPPLGHTASHESSQRFGSAETESYSLYMARKRSAKGEKAKKGLTNYKTCHCKDTCDMLDDDLLPFPLSQQYANSHSAALNLENEANWDYLEELSDAGSDDEPPVQGNLFHNDEQAFDIASTASSASAGPALCSDVDLDEWRGFDEFQDLDEQISLEEMMDVLDDMVGSTTSSVWTLRLGGGTSVSLAH